jgi:DNA-directed RNA polymerase subunit RPC12/RpoP
MQLKHPILVGGIVLVSAVLLATGRNPFAVAVAALAAYAIFRVGWAMLGGLARPVPEPPPAGELRRVKIGYRCSICGAEVRMTVAPDADPEPPRHCQEEMDLMAPIE